MIPWCERHGGFDAGLGRAERRVVLVRRCRGSDTCGASVAGDPDPGERSTCGAGSRVFRALRRQWTAVDCTGATAAGAASAGVLHDPLGAAADGADRLQPALSLVRG